MTLKTYMAPQYGFDALGVWTKATRDMQQDMDTLSEQEHRKVEQGLVGGVGRVEVAASALSLAHAHESRPCLCPYSHSQACRCAGNYAAPHQTEKSLVDQGAHFSHSYVIP
jgi:hypothetical protein